MRIPKLISREREDKALAWATRLDGGELTPDEQRDLDRWLADDPAHPWRLAHYSRFCGQVNTTILALEANGDLVVSSPVRPRRLGWAVGFAAAIVGAVLVAWTMGRPNQVDTRMAQRQSVALADGTRVDLNARTAMVVQLRGHERRVKLEQGEAYFAVAGEPRRPFYVDTPAGTIRVTGTRFDVRVVKADTLEVTVIEGVVAVRVAAQAGGPDAPSLTLAARDQITISDGRAKIRHLTYEVAQDSIAWREGKVVFDETPLALAVTRFAAYHNWRVTVSADVAELPLGGRYTLDDFEQFLGSLEMTLPVKVLRGDREARILQR